MSTQTTSVTIGNSQKSRVFTATSTDGQWNIQLSSNASQNLGLEMPNTTVNVMAGSYAAGLAAVRITDSITQRTERWTMAAKGGYICHSETGIPAFNVKPTSLVEVYSMQVDATAGDTAVLAWVESGNQAELFKVTTASDQSYTSMTAVSTGQSLGDMFFGKQITKVSLAAEDGATIPSIKFLRADGAVVYTQYGNVRSPSAGATSTQYNLVANVNWMVGKGDNLQVAISTA